MKRFLLILFLPMIAFADTGVSLSAGKVTGKLATTSSRIAIFSEQKSEWLTDVTPNLSWQIELSHAHWNNQYFEDIKTTTLTPSLKYNWHWQQLEMFLTLGVGAAYLTETRFSSRRFGSNWLFEDKLSLGWQMTKQQSISLSFNHYSNANLASVNDGSTFVLFDYRFTW